MDPTGAQAATAPAKPEDADKGKKPLKLDLSGIIRARAGSRGRWIPGAILRGLERVIHQDELNEMLRVAHPAEGSAFSRRILDHLGITVTVEGLDLLDASGREAYVFASNHPLGGLDGIALVAVLGEFFGDENIRVLVNDLLMNVTPLAGVFLPVNKYGSRGARESSRLLGEAMAAGRQIVMFPAGLVSRLKEPEARGDEDNGSPIRDLPWKKSFVSKALEYGRRIVPVHFEAMNSMRFYRTAKWRKKLGLKVNIEQALLPGEVCRSRGKHFVIRLGSPLDPAAMGAEGLSPSEIASRIYSAVYALPSRGDRG